MAALSLALLCGVFAGSRTVFASENDTTSISQEAQTVSYDASCDALPGETFGRIMDKNMNSFFNAKSDMHIIFHTYAPVCGLYFILENPCTWTLTLPDGTVRQCGENELIHEYIGLDDPVTGFEIDIPRYCRLSEVYVFSEGRLPDWVQIWEPPCESADLLVLPTHADDEYLWFGGAIPYYAGELGYNVQVAYLINHDRSSYRRHELLNGLWTVGVKHYPIITSPFPDDLKTKASLANAKMVYGYSEVLEYQVKILRRFSPKVVLGHDIDGEYGHGAHKINARTLLEALPLTSDPEAFPESARQYGTCSVEKCYIHLWEGNRIEITWSDIMLSRFGGKSSLDVAQDGYACHKSQGTVHKIKESGKNDCRLFGLAYTTVGYDTPGVNDMFEHINMSDHAKTDADKADETSDTVSPTDGKTSDSDNIPVRVNGTDFLPNAAWIAVAGTMAVMALIIAAIWLKRRK